MGKPLSRFHFQSASQQIHDLLSGYFFSRVVAAQNTNSHGGGYTAIFKNRQGHEKPIPYGRVHEMTTQLQKALRKSGQLKRRDKTGQDCSSPVLATLLTAKEELNRTRHCVRRLN